MLQKIQKPHLVHRMLQDAPCASNSTTPLELLGIAVSPMSLEPTRFTCVHILQVGPYYALQPSTS